MATAEDPLRLTPGFERPWCSESHGERAEYRVEIDDGVTVVMDLCERHSEAYEDERVAYSAFFAKCHCRGRNDDWGYHHPEGCAATAQGFGMAADVRPGKAWDDPWEVEMEVTDGE